MIIEPNQNTTKILQPGKQAFNFPTSFVAAQNSAVLRFLTLAIGFMRLNQLDVEFSQLFVERVGVIRLIADYSFWSLINETLANSRFDKSDFVRRSTRCVNGERKTKAICHCYELRAFAALGLSHSATPFFATINVPSIKHSDKSMPPRECKSSAKVSGTNLSVPSLIHAWK